MRLSDAQPEPVCLLPTPAGALANSARRRSPSGARRVIMRLLRGLIGAVLWILAALLGLVGLVLCVTIILLPVGIPLLGVSSRLITRAMQLMMPRAVSHPIDELSKKTKKKTKKAKKKTKKSDVGSAASDA